MMRATRIATDFPYKPLGWTETTISGWERSTGPPHESPENAQRCTVCATDEVVLHYTSLFSDGLLLKQPGSGALTSRMHHSEDRYTETQDSKRLVLTERCVRTK